MKGLEDNELYHLFKARLTAVEVIDDSEDENWAVMENLLEEKSGKRPAIVLLYRIAAGIAAMFLLFISFQFFKKTPTSSNKLTKSNMERQIILSPYKTNPTGQLQGAAPVVQDKPLQTALALTKKPERSSKSYNTPNVVSKDNYRSVNNNNLQPTDSINIQARSLTVFNLTAERIDSIPSRPDFTVVLPSLKKSVATVNDKKTIKTSFNGGPKMTLAVLSAPDLNSVNSTTKGGQVGTNLGLQFSLQLTRRLSISSGATYAIKPYSTSFSNYRTSNPGWWEERFSTTGTPDNVEANCKVLDIPLDINYQLYSKHGSSLMIGTGLSSYFMLSENYRFNFVNPGMNTVSLQINNQNQHLLGVFNLNATYTRQVNSRFGIMIQPYMKLPLTQIGFGQVDLQSTGVALGLSWNINSLKIK